MKAKQAMLNSLQFDISTLFDTIVGLVAGWFLSSFLKVGRKEFLLFQENEAKTHADLTAGIAELGQLIAQVRGQEKEDFARAMTREELGIAIREVRQELKELRAELVGRVG